MANKPVTMPTPQELIAAYTIVDTTNEYQHENLKAARLILRGIKQLFANERQRLAPLVPATTLTKES